MQPIPAPGANNSAQLADMAQKIADTEAQLQTAAKTASDAAKAAADAVTAAAAAKNKADAAMTKANAADTAAGTASGTAGSASSAATAAADAAATAKTKADAAKTAADAAKAAADTAAASMPQPATAVPPEAGTRGARGDGPRYAREDHTHEVRARRKRVTLAAGTGAYAGKFVATWVFDKPFATKPIIVCSPEDDGGFPVMAGAVTASFTQDANGKWTSVVVRGWRSQPIPQNLVSLLVSAVFNLFGGSPVGCVIGLTAAEETPTVV